MKEYVIKVDNTKAELNVTASADTVTLGDESALWFLLTMVIVTIY